MKDKPFPQSFWVREGLLCAGCYPGSLDPLESDTKLQGLLDGGFCKVFSLMEENERSWGGHPFVPYGPRLQALAGQRGVIVDCQRFPIRDATAPTHQAMQQILDRIDKAIGQELATYIHCWGGHGRTGTVVACYLIRHGLSPREAINQVVSWRAELPKSHYPFEGDQEKFVLSFAEVI